MNFFLIGFLTILCSLNYPIIAAQNASDQGAITGTVIPIGTIMPFAGSTAPSGWVLAYGQQVSQTGTYAKLFAVIGSTYCTTDHGGTCTGGNFRLPDLRGRNLAGKDDMGGSTASRITSAGTIDGTVLGKAGGEQTDTSNVTVAQQPSFSNHSDLDIAHGHEFTQPYVPGHYHAFSLSAAGQTLSLTNITLAGSITGGSHSHNITVTKGSNAFGSYAITFSNNSGSLTSEGTQVESPTHSHSVSGTTNIAHTHSASTVSGDVGLISGSGGCSGNAGNTCQATGGSVTSLSTTNKSISAHSRSQNVTLTNNSVNNLAPTVIVNYIIKY